jgi:arylsulfatase
MKLKMAVYAAQIDRMDQGIGKVIEKIKELGKFGNTLIMFLSDNGGSAEGGVYGKDFWQNGVPPGGKDGYHSYGMGWANYSNTPFRKYKQYTHEGGISTPFIACWPAIMKDKGFVTHQPAHVMDIMPTFCQISGAVYPETYKGNKILPMEGKSLKPIFNSQIREPNEIICWEHMGSVAIRKGNWKLVAERNEKWELYDLEEDRTELDNLIDKNPDKAEELHEDWMDWAERCGVRISEIHRKSSD